MNKTFIKRVITITLAVLTVSFFIYGLINHEKTSIFVKNIKSTLSPFIAGLAIAYIINPLYTKLQYLTNKVDKKQALDKHKKLKALTNILCIVISESILIGLIALIIFSIIPSFTESINSIINSMPSTLSSYTQQIDSLLNNYDWLKPIVGNNTNEIIEKAQDFLVNKLEYNISFLSKTIVNVISSTITCTINICIAIISSFMLLANKDDMLNQADRLIKCISGKYYKIVHEELCVANKKFSGFFVGKTIDSLIIGTISLIALIILGVERAGLIAFLIGFTNIIPIVGPFLGAIPSAIIVFNQSPKLAIYFAVFILIIQQVDGNIIGPKCIGNSTDLNSFWALFALLFFGKIWGIIGMIVGIPLFAVLYDVVDKLITYKLSKPTVIESVKDNE